MDELLQQLNLEVYEKCALSLTDFQLETESQEYHACRFNLNGPTILCRKAKITPKKSGQFVSYWKRSENGPIEPFDETDQIDLYVVNVRMENKFGQFVFPKSVLIQKGIISTDQREGKRAFRVYPSWDIAPNKQAERTQKWQLNYFYEIGGITDFKKVISLYNEK